MNYYVTFKITDLSRAKGETITETISGRGITSAEKANQAALTRIARLQSSGVAAVKIAYKVCR